MRPFLLMAALFTTPFVTAPETADAQLSTLGIPIDVWPI
jgi:hypothetical protein